MMTKDKENELMENKILSGWRLSAEQHMELQILLAGYKDIIKE